MTRSEAEKLTKLLTKWNIRVTEALEQQKSYSAAQDIQESMLFIERNGTVTTLILCIQELLDIVNDEFVKSSGDA